MKKLLVILMLMTLLTGCSQNDNLVKKVSTLPTGESFIFEEYDKPEGFKTIYEFPNGRKVVSEFKNISYKDNDNDTKEISLEEALTKNIITIDNLIEKMVLVDAINDGGSKIYQFKTAGNIYLVACNTLNGSKDIIIGTNKYIGEQCDK